MRRYILIIFTLVFSIPVLANTEDRVNGEHTPLSAEDKAAMSPEHITWAHVEELLNLMGLELTEAESLKERNVFEGRQIKDYMTLQRLDSARHRKYGGTASHQLKGFGPEAGVFYAAIGGNMLIQSQADSIMKGARADPRWMENLLHEATSPIGVFSFFCFVMASGQVNLLYSRWLSPGWNAGPFKRGPFKGRQIRINPVFSPEVLKGKLDTLRLDATFNRVIGKYGQGIPSNRFSGWRYQGAKLAPKGALFLAGPLGMSAGMMASNIVHELDYIFSHNPHFSPCMDQIKGKEVAIDSEDGRLHCDLFWDGMGSTIVSWAPGLASLITASVLSHAAVNLAYGLAGGTIKGARHLGARPVQVSQNILKGWAKRAGVRVPWSMLVNGASFIPTPATTGIKVGAKGVGVFIKSIAQWVKRQILPPGMRMVGGKMVPSGGVGFRFINLLAFMLTDTWVTHDFYSAIWTETIKAGDVSDGMRDFIKYHNVDSDTPAKICDSDDESDCEYHESIFSAHETALTFDRWRQFRLEKAMAAHHNWFKYVSSTTGSFEQIYNVYKLLFQAKRDRNTFHAVKYFGDFSEEGLFSKDASYVPEEGTVRSVFGAMINQVDEHLKGGSVDIPNPANVALDVVSISPSHFLKPETDVNIDDEDRLFVLGSLFSVVDPRVSLEPFYSDEWEEALRQEEERIYKYENPDTVVREHFSQLEQATQNLKDATLKGISEGVLRKAALASVVINNRCAPEESDAEDAAATESDTATPEITDCVSETDVEESVRFLVGDSIPPCALVRDECISNTEVEWIMVNQILGSMTDYITGVLSKAVMSLPKGMESAPIHSNGRTKLSEYANQVSSDDGNWESTALSKQYNEIYNESFEIVAQKDGLDSSDQVGVDSFVHHSESFVAFYFDKWIAWIQSERDKILSQGTLVDGAAVTERAENRLRKRVLSAGLEYLNNIIELEQKKYGGRRLPHASIELKDKIKDLPPELLSVYNGLGTDNIFAQLYAKTFVRKKTKAQQMFQLGSEATKATVSSTAAEAPTDVTVNPTGEVADPTKVAVTITEASTNPTTENKDQPYIQMKPEAQGMHMIVGGNELYQVKAESYDVNYHPDRLRMLSTPGFMDFVIASTVCGPDPKEVKELTEEQMTDLLKDKDKSLEDIMDSVPVFGSFISGVDWIAGSGSSYAFYPPRITTLDEKTRLAICSGAYNRGSGIVEDLYDGHFPVGDKVYSNLLHLVLDHIGFKDGETEISSMEEFDRWWVEKIVPYMAVFSEAADQEYKRIVKHDFMGPLFMTDVEETAIASYLVTDSSSLHDVNSSDTSEWDHISKLSKKWFGKHNHLYSGYDSHFGSVRPLVTYNVNLPKGVFQNMHFEVLYWSDMILHFAKKKNIPDERMWKLEEALKQFAGEFNVSECSVVDIECQKKWADKFLKEGGELQRLNNLLVVDIGEALDIFVKQLMIRANPDEDAISGQQQVVPLSMEEQEERRRKAISAFKCDSTVAGCDLPLQLLNFSVIRLNQILREATNYVNQVGYISEHPDVQKVNAPGL